MIATIFSLFFIDYQLFYSSVVECFSWLLCFHWFLFVIRYLFRRLLFPWTIPVLVMERMAGVILVRWQMVVKDCSCCCWVFWLALFAVCWCSWSGRRWL